MFSEDGSLFRTTMALSFPITTGILLTRECACVKSVEGKEGKQRLGGHRSRNV